MPSASASRDALQAHGARTEAAGVPRAAFGVHCLLRGAPKLFAEGLQRASPPLFGSSASLPPGEAPLGGPPAPGAAASGADPIGGASRAAVGAPLAGPASARSSSCLVSTR